MICVICKGKTDNIFLFDEENFNKCKMLCARKKYKLKFSDVVLPDCINSDIGYHVKC